MSNVKVYDLSDENVLNNVTNTLTHSQIQDIEYLQDIEVNFIETLEDNMVVDGNSIENDKNLALIIAKTKISEAVFWAIRGIREN